jgi:hypothetical protein
MFSIEDCIKHALQMAISQTQSWRAIVDEFIRSSLLPYIHGDHTRRAVLFPVRRDSPEHSYKIRVPSSAGRIEERTPKGRPVLSEHAPMPKEYEVQFFVNEDEMTSPGHSLPFDALGKSPQLPLLERFEMAVFVMSFLKAKLSSHAAELHHRYGEDETRVYDLMIEVEKAFTRVLVADLAEHVAELGDCESLAFVVHGLYMDSGGSGTALLPSWLPTEFIESLGLIRFRSLAFKANDVRHIHALVNLADDDRVPVEFLVAAIEVGQVLDPTDDDWQLWLDRVPGREAMAKAISKISLK